MKLGEPLWAIVRADGIVAGDGECPCVYESQASADDELGAVGDRLRRLNGPDLRVVPVTLTEAPVELANPSLSQSSTTPAPAENAKAPEVKEER